MREAHMRVLMREGLEQNPAASARPRAQPRAHTPCGDNKGKRESPSSPTKTRTVTSHVLNTGMCKYFNVGKCTCSGVVPPSVTHMSPPCPRRVR